uniref:Uncharacterized protein n=1 Tax=Myoviridae sp. ctkfK18 TaxID=2825165 RepID=A0A8S5VGR6_9CAUD|nr:MAG TPA: hypothetical protein [Myoviridae sp. ctkfK18]
MGLYIKVSPSWSNYCYIGRYSYTKLITCSYFHMSDQTRSIPLNIE